MKVEWKQLMQGTINSIFIKQEVEKVAAERIAICNVCPEYSVNVVAADSEVKFPYAHCTVCKCNMYLKTRALSASCPEGKWMAEIDDDSSNEILKTPELKEEMDNYKRDLNSKKINDHGN